VAAARMAAAAKAAALAAALAGAGNIGEQSSNAISMKYMAKMKSELSAMA